MPTSSQTRRIHFKNTTQISHTLLSHTHAHKNPYLHTYIYLYCKSREKKKHLFSVASSTTFFCILFSERKTCLLVFPSQFDHCRRGDHVPIYTYHQRKWNCFQTFSRIQIPSLLLTIPPLAPLGWYILSRLIRRYRGVDVRADSKVFSDLGGHVLLVTT